MVSTVSLPEGYSRNTATASTVNTWSCFFQANRDSKSTKRVNVKLEISRCAGWFGDCFPQSSSTARTKGNCFVTALPWPVSMAELKRALRQAHRAIKQRRDLGERVLPALAHPSGRRSRRDSLTSQRTKGAREGLAFFLICPR